MAVGNACMDIEIVLCYVNMFIFPQDHDPDFMG